MSLTSLLVRTAVIQTATTSTDRYNNTVLDWTSPTSTTTTAWVAQTATIENQDHRDATVDTVIATFPAGTAITAQNRVVIDGQTYEVDGKPNRAWTPRGEHHVECVLREVRG